MNAELSFGTSAGGLGGDEATCFGTDAPVFAAGVQWLGRAEPREGRRVDFGRQQHRTEPLILGTAHGPRLLELVRMAG